MAKGFGQPPTEAKQKAKSPMGAKGKGFNQAPSSQPKQRKGKKARGKLDEYVLIHHGQDGKARVLRLMASSHKEATRKFNIFIDSLNLCLSGVSDRELQRFVEENPL